jgi:Ca2+-binding RTX toxin-like protein
MNSNFSLGGDTMRGLGGNDTYRVNSLDDVVIENANAGIDIVQSSVTFTLPANVENLTLAGLANINGTGNSLNNIVTGNAGNNVLRGGAGADDLYGGAGNDKLYGDGGSDNLYGGPGHNDLYGGGGTSSQNVNQDTYYLTGGAANPDVVHIAKGDSTFQLDATKTPINYDLAYGFDKYDKLDLDSGTIMPNTVVGHAAHPYGALAGFKINQGVITLQDSQGHNVNINSVFLAGLAYKFLVANCLPINVDKAVSLLVNINDKNWHGFGGHGQGEKGVWEADHNEGGNNFHTVVLEAHSTGGITAVDIVGNFTSFIGLPGHFI